MELFEALVPTLHSAAAPRAAGPPQGGAGLALRAGGGRSVGGRQGRAVQLQVTTLRLFCLYCYCKYSPDTVALYNAVTSETVAAISAVKSWGILATLAVLWWSLALVLPPLCIGQVWSLVLQKVPSECS